MEGRSAGSMSGKGSSHAGCSQDESAKAIRYFGQCCKVGLHEILQITLGSIFRAPVLFNFGII